MVETQLCKRFKAYCVVMPTHSVYQLGEQCSRVIACIVKRCEAAQTPYTRFNTCCRAYVYDTKCKLAKMTPHTYVRVRTTLQVPGIFFANPTNSRSHSGSAARHTNFLILFVSACAARTTNVLRKHQAYTLYCYTTGFGAGLG